VPKALPQGDVKMRPPLFSKVQFWDRPNRTKSWRDLQRDATHCPLTRVRKTYTCASCVTRGVRV